MSVLLIEWFHCIHVYTHTLSLATHSLTRLPNLAHTFSFSLTHTLTLSLPPSYTQCHTYIQTDATMTELEIEANIKFSEWSILQESGHQLVPCYGAGYTGLTNLGNSCYLNSVMQILFSIPDFQKRWKGHGCV